MALTLIRVAIALAALAGGPVSCHVITPLSRAPLPAGTPLETGAILVLSQQSRAVQALVSL